MIGVTKIKLKSTYKFSQVFTRFLKFVITNITNILYSYVRNNHTDIQLDFKTVILNMLLTKTTLD